MTKGLRIGSLFSGIGGLELGLEWSGLGHIVWQVEQNAYCRGVLARHWPEVPRFDDIRTVGAHNLPRVDVLCGGFPCQDVSAAGKGAGLAGERSGLWREYARVIAELRPRAAIVENVASGARRWLPHVRRDLHMLGYHTCALALSAADVGAPHLRRRVFVVAYAEHFDLRQQQGWIGGENGGGAAEPRHDGPPRAFADANGERELQSGGGEPAERRWARDGGGEGGAWSTSSGIRRVAHGVPHRVDRLKALGNAVVPQCGEVIGRVTVALLAAQGIL